MKWRLGLLSLVVLTGTLLLPIGVRDDCGWIDSISGSTKRQTIWRVGFSSTPTVFDSPLAVRYRELGQTWEPDWINVQDTHRSLLGQTLGHSHAQAPEIYVFAQMVELQRIYLAGASDDEVRQLFQTMTRGTSAEKTAAIEAACEKAFAAEPTTRPG